MKVKDYDLSGLTKGELLHLIDISEEAKLIMLDAFVTERAGCTSCRLCRSIKEKLPPGHMMLEVTRR